MTLTKEEAIRRHRLMWNWIAQTSIQEQRCVSKQEAFKHFRWEYVLSYCWCCAFADNQTKQDHTRYCGMCKYCPIVWPYFACSDGFELLYDEFVDASNENSYVKTAKIAYQIAELPERKD